MASNKSKTKKTPSKKEHTHVMPHAKVAKGRRPHTEPASEPYQPSMLSEEDLAPIQNVAADSHEVSQEPETYETHTIAKEEVIIEGQPAPRAPRTKIDLKNQIENVKGMVQMGTALVKNSFPKPFEIAEKVVEDWKVDGDFSELPIEQPLLQFYLGLGLRKVKQTEKELEQKLEGAGVLPVFRQQWQKAQKLFK